MNFGLIADGNRRWAKSQNLPIKEGHYRGFLAIKDELLPVLRDDPDFTSLVIYGFSTENWKRSPLEVKNLMNLFHDLVDQWLPEMIEEHIRFIHAGRKDRLPKSLLQKIEKAETQTKSFKKFAIYLCLDYGSQDEICRTIKHYSEVSNLTPESLQSHLEIPTLDLILRTGGEYRLSNFCLWQAAYAEFFFEEKFLPELTRADAERILKQFREKDRRVGK